MTNNGTLKQVNSRCLHYKHQHTIVVHAKGQELVKTTSIILTNSTALLLSTVLIRLLAGMYLVVHKSCKTATLLLSLDVCQPLSCGI